MIFGRKVDLNLLALLVILFGAAVLTVPVVSVIPPHPDEHQFPLNAFSIMNGEELQNYLHIASTEYTLAGFFTLINMFTKSGVNFPQGSPTPVTYYYAHLMGSILYFLTFILAALVVQKRKKEVQFRTIIFAILYFGSLSMFERFLRINSDSFSIFIFLNFLIISLWQHLHKPSGVEMFLLNALFVFLATFTNLKSLFFIFPVVLINTLAPILLYKHEREDQKALSRLYRIILSSIGIITVCLVLWKVAIPKEFDPVKYWYTIKKTIVHGTQFDFDYPSQSYKSWLVYIYDLLVYQLGTIPVFLTFILFAFCVYKKRIGFVWFEIKKHLNLTSIINGEIYKLTELILFTGFIFYYIGVSARIVHWSRWGAPLGILAMMLLGAFIEKLVFYSFDKFSFGKSYIIGFFPLFLIFMWGPRISLAVDLHRSGYSQQEDYHLTRLDIKDFLRKKNIPFEDAKEKLAWFTGYTPEIKSISFEQVVEEENKNIEYLLWPEWNAGLLLTEKNVDRSTHNQRSFVDTYAESIEHRFPTALSKYIYRTRLFAWKILGIAWIPEIDSLVEPFYSVTKIKRPLDNLTLHYKISFKDLSHYDSPYSKLFNLKNLKDSYMFAPCYSYQAVVNVSDGSFVEAPQELAPFGKTAGLYCHSIRFRVQPKGVYAVKINGLPNDSVNQQKLYYNFGEFSWDPKNKIASFGQADTFITGEFGVATREENLPQLEFEVLYTLDQNILKQIKEVKAKST